MIRTRDDIDYHDDGSSSAWGGGTPYPAINVKDHSTSFYELRDSFPPEVPDKEVESYGNRAWETNKYRFWELHVQDAVDLVWGVGKDIDFCSAGRSGGWLVVRGLGTWESAQENWSEEDVQRWKEFDEQIKTVMGQLTSITEIIDVAHTLYEQDHEKKEAPARIEAEDTELWLYAASWGSYITSYDLGACMYGFSEDCLPQSEAHRWDCMKYITEHCLPLVLQDPSQYDEYEKEKLLKLRAWITVAPLKEQ